MPYATPLDRLPDRPRWAWSAALVAGFPLAVRGMPRSSPILFVTSRRGRSVLPFMPGRELLLRGAWAELCGGFRSSLAAGRGRERPAEAIRPAV